MLLTGILVNVHELSSESDAQEFLGWLAKAPLGSPEKFIRALEQAPDARTHLLLDQAELHDYDFATLDGRDQGTQGVVSLERIRRLVRAKGTDPGAATEQWLDLLEKTGMTHGFVLSRAPPAIFLMNLPAATSSVAAERRIAVMRHLSCELAALWSEPGLTPTRD
jgi:hypothetical protein